MEKLVDLKETSLFGHEIRFFYHHGRYYFIAKDLSRCLNVTVNYLKKLHKTGHIRMYKQKIESGRYPVFVMSLKNLLVCLGFSDTQVGIDTNKFLYTEVLPAIANDGEYIMDADKYEPVIEFIQSLKKR